MEIRGSIVTIESSITTLQRIWIQSNGAKIARFSLFGPAGSGDFSSQIEIAWSHRKDQITEINRNKNADFLAIK
tara:strand:- start:2339 stop:2560 length:222 start_codon:yes stop_codon:yes gene_type:complete